MAFQFDTRRVRPSGPCELVVPIETDPETIKQDAFNRQFDRHPYAVSFLSSGQIVILVTLHVDYGNGDERDRLRLCEDGAGKTLALGRRQELRVVQLLEKITPVPEASRSRSKRTPAAMIGPAQHPRPASSTPAISRTATRARRVTARPADIGQVSPIGSLGESRFRRIR